MITACFSKRPVGYLYPRIFNKLTLFEVTVLISEKALYPLLPRCITHSRCINVLLCEIRATVSQRCIHYCSFSMDLERGYRSMNFNQTSVFVYIYIYPFFFLFFLIFAKLQNVSSHRFEYALSSVVPFVAKIDPIPVISQFLFSPISAIHCESRVSMVFWIDNRWRGEGGGARNWDSSRRFSRNECKSVFWPWFAFTAVRSSRK